MANKKHYMKGLNALLGDTDSDVITAEEPVAQPEVDAVGLETKATFAMSVDQLEKLRAVSFWDRRNIKETLFLALSEFFDGMDEKHLERAVKSFKENKR